MNGTYDYLDGLIVSHVCETIRGLAGISGVRWPDRFEPVENSQGGDPLDRMVESLIGPRHSALRSRVHSPKAR